MLTQETSITWSVQTPFSKEDAEKAVRTLDESNEEWKCFRCDFALDG